VSPVICFYSLDLVIGESGELPLTSALREALAAPAKAGEGAPVPSQRTEQKGEG